jgi:alpha-methylacyl-CoA racemase
MPGPLEGYKVVEFAGLGPAPFCAMLLADFGAEVLRIARPDSPLGPHDVTCRSRATLRMDLRAPGASATVLDLVAKADAVIEGFRPGVMERLGLGPQPCLEANPRLVYGRMTGWGQQGPLAAAAGHDINYIAISGALHAIGPAGGKPVPPLNLVGDYGGGAMLLAVGLLAALLEARGSGRGQVVDAAMTEGAALLCAGMFGNRAAGRVSTQRGDNLVDGGAPFYDTYACADGKYVAIGAIEPQFYRLLRDRCGIEDPAFDAQMERSQWPLLKMRMADVFLTRTRDEWCALLEGPTPASRRCSTGTRRRAIRTTRRAAASSRCRAWCSRRPPRASRALPSAQPTPAREATPQELLRAWGVDAAALQPTPT